MFMLRSLQGLGGDEVTSASDNIDLRINERLDAHGAAGVETEQVILHEAKRQSQDLM